MATVSQRWENLYHQTPLCDVPFHFANLRRSPFSLQYLSTILSFCPSGGHTLETGVGTGFGAIWLSLRGVCAEGLDYAPGIVERARQINSMLGGSASFRFGDIFHLFAECQARRIRYDVIHSQGTLEHFALPQIRAALAQQVACAEWVVFSVPSVYYPFEPEFGNERLLPLAEWERILSPFDVAELNLYGDPQHGEREHVLCVLRGQAVDEELLSLMSVPEEPYPDGITIIVHTRNEERHLSDCLTSAQSVADEIVVCDMESTDRTVEIARTFTPQIVHHPLVKNFDIARNVSAMRASHRWIMYLDADERIPPGLGPALRELIARHGHSFEAAMIPFRHHFAGHWMQCLYPGYTAPRLLKNGRFYFNARLHAGAVVDGRSLFFPADNPDLALVHYSFDSMSHYLEKLNRYTDGEAANLHRDGVPFHWQQAMRHFVQDFSGYYDHRQAYRDGAHGFIYSFLSGFYRFEQHAKLYETRFRQGQLQPGEQQVPPSVEAVLEYMLSVVREKPRPQAPALQVVDAPNAASVAWCGPLLDPSGYGESSRNLALALDDAGVTVAGQVLPWNQDAPLSEEERQRITLLTQQAVKPGFVQIIEDFPHSFARHPEASIVIGRTFFETDRLPQPWVQACNRMDFIWVPTEFNRETFARSGVLPEKLVVIPECFDPAPYLAAPTDPPMIWDWREDGKTVFLSVFDWTLHKGWDVLLRGFLEAFEGREDATLVLKVWSTLGYSDEAIRQQAADYVQREMGHDLLADSRIRWVSKRLTREELIGLYRAADAFVLPSRGEGWGRPYLEAMACGLPTLGTNWSANTAFMTAENSYLLDYRLVEVPEACWPELPTYRGHRWAEPSVEDLKQQMRRIVQDRDEAQQIGKRAQAEVTERFSQATVGQLMAAELARLQETRIETRRAHPRLEELLPDRKAVVPLAISKPAEASAPEATSSEVAHATTPTEPVADRRSVTGGKKAGTPVPKAPVAVRWEGDFFQWHSLAHVNREFCLALLGQGAEVSLVPSGHTHFAPQSDPRFARLGERSFAPLSGPADVHVRHFFPPRLERPGEGHFVLCQPWEYGFLPRQWIKPVKEEVDEVWCYSEYVRQVYLASGIAAEKLQVVPLGVDAEVFHPEAPPYVFTTEAGAATLRQESRNQDPFVFLFVGGTLHRKGIDILLDAYVRAFSAYDDVVLVIKDMGTQTVYRGQNERERILGLVADSTRPRIVYLEHDLSAHELAGIYTAADCLVQPYRGEGFCLPALEAMACGIPVLVPAGGPTDDFVDETVGWRLAAERKPFGDGQIGPMPCVGPTWMLEVSPQELARKMREAYGKREEVARRGKAARQRVEAGWTWRHAGQAAMRRLDALRARPQRKASPAGAVTARPVSAPGGKPALIVVDSTRTKGKGVTQDANSVHRANGSLMPMRNRPTISLCMIVKNEERVLGDCLASILPYVEEVILVDTGSTDRTVEIAEAAGPKVKVFHFPWGNDFSEARNVSLSHATMDWVLWMDADDTILPECGAKLHELAMLAEDRVTGFILQVHIPPAPGEHGFTVVDHVKLFRNGLNLRFEGRIHEQILEPIYRMGGTIERSDLYVVHSGYDYSPEGQKRKRERDLTILDLELAERPDFAFLHYNRGMTFHHLKQHEQAISALERYLELTEGHESTTRKVYALLAGSHLELRQLERAKERLEQGLRLFPQDPELNFRGGILYREVGNVAAAERCYLVAIRSREVGHLDSLDVSMTGYKAYHNLGLLYRDSGRLPEAEASWRAAVGENAAFVPSWLGLGQLFVQTRRFEDARGVAEKLAALDAALAEGLRQDIARMAGESR